MDTQTSKSQRTQAAYRTFAFALGLVSCLSTPISAHAGLVINRQFNPSIAPANMVGGGNLPDIFDAASTFWENAFPDPNETWVVNLEYEWAALPGQNGSFILNQQGGSPHRILSGRIRFDNSAVQFFADPTPQDNSEYTQHHELFWDTPDGPLNTGRQYFGATGDAAIGVDLLTIAKHEIGHALGLSADNTASPLVIDVTSPRPFPGVMIDTKGGDHLMNLDGAVMGQDLFGAGTRTLISGVDVLAEAQISLFDRPNLNPYVVPEPAPLALGLIGLMVGMPFLKRGGWRRRGLANTSLGSSKPLP
ncbi:MAG TPA: hypothetical protein PLX89_17455 [Verrucomicrobiota bacterium]|nr:hypothetical protein [Verrucomicrobiales bacterium]HRI14786.1 hypothetical protein [Verrucomicrobiota bacterium]